MMDNTASARRRQAAHWLMAWEFPLILFVIWLVFISIPLYLGGIGLGWDAMNHQIYLGWVADHSRFDQDYMGALLQSYQFPYLYWPAYRLAIGGFDGMSAGVVLSTLHLLAVPPVWMVAKALISGQDVHSAALRVAAVILAFMSAVPLKTLEATNNDLLAAAPLLWAIAIAFRAITDGRPVPKRVVPALLSGLIGGVAVACKLSNGPLVVLLPFLFLFCQGAPLARLKWTTIHAIAIGAGFIVTYGYWGYQLWLQFGNPLFPFYDGYFEPMRQMLGWNP
jgi:hypothetical protein